MTAKLTFILSLLTLHASACKKDDKPPPVAPDPTPAVAAPAPTETAPAKTGTLADLGLPQGKTPMDGVVTGGQVTDEQLTSAKAMGVQTVVNLRAEAEAKDYETEAAKVGELGMKYIHIPMDHKTGDGFTEDNAKKLASILAEEHKPMIVHCASGQRVGALFALKAFFVDHASPDDAVASGAATGMTKPELVAKVRDIMAAAPKK